VCSSDLPLARPVKIGTQDISQGVVVKGLPDVWVRLGRCCTPVPGDQIIGFVTRGQGVSVHRTDCPNVKSLRREPERLIDVTWSEGKPTSFTVAIMVEALDRTRLLSDVATVLSDSHVNILSATSATAKDRITRLRFTFELADIVNLVRAVARPYPGAFSWIAADRVTIWRARAGLPRGPGSIGSVWRADSRSFTVNCGEGSLEVLEGEIEGGLQPRVGDRLDPLERAA